MWFSPLFLGSWSIGEYPDHIIQKWFDTVNLFSSFLFTIFQFLFDFISDAPFGDAGSVRISPTPQSGKKAGYVRITARPAVRDVSRRAGRREAKGPPAEKTVPDGTGKTRMSGE